MKKLKQAITSGRGYRVLSLALMCFAAAIWFFPYILTAIQWNRARHDSFRGHEITLPFRWRTSSGIGAMWEKPPGTLSFRNRSSISISDTALMFGPHKSLEYRWLKVYGIGDQTIRTDDYRAIPFAMAGTRCGHVATLPQSKLMSFACVTYDNQFMIEFRGDQGDIGGASSILAQAMGVQPGDGP